MESDVFGIPAHPLLVHAIVVLVPLAAIGVVLCAVWPAARRRLVVATVLLALATVVLTPLVTESGEELEEQVPRSELVHEHAESGEQALGYVLALLVGAVAVGALAATDRWGRVDDDGTTTLGGRPVGRSARRALGATAVAVALLASATSVYGIVRIGHSGAEATWHGVASGD